MGTGTSVSIQAIRLGGGPYVQYDLIQGAQARDAADGQMIVRTCKLVGIPVSPGMSDAKVLSKCIPFLPSLFDHHPDTDNFPNATLRERNVRSVPSSYQAMVDLVYRGPGPNDWSLEDVTQSEFLETFATGDGSKALTVWYKQGEADTTQVAPAGADQVSMSVTKQVPKRVMRVRGFQNKSYWDSNKASIRALIGKINKHQWGSNPSDSVGTWLFAGLSLFTNDFGRTFTIELFFINDPKGHYPVRAYLNIHGQHPPDCATEQKLRALGPPPIGGMFQLNGVGIYSVYDEDDFNGFFNFVPN